MGITKSIACRSNLLLLRIARVDSVGTIAGRPHDSFVLDKAVSMKDLLKHIGQPVQYKYCADKGYFVQSHG